MDLCTSIPRHDDPQSLLDIGDDNEEVIRVYRSLGIEDYLKSHEDTWFGLFYLNDPDLLKEVWNILYIPKKIKIGCFSPEKSLRINGLMNIEKARRAHEIYSLLEQEFEDSSLACFSDFLLKSLLEMKMGK